MIHARLRAAFDDFRGRGGGRTDVVCGLASLVEGGLDENLGLAPKSAAALKGRPVARLYNAGKGDPERIAILCDFFPTTDDATRNIVFVNQFTSLSTSFIRYWDGPVVHVNPSLYAEYFGDAPNLLVAVLAAHLQPRVILNVSGGQAGKENLRPEVLLDIRRKHGPAVVTFMNDLVTDFWRAQASIQLVASDLVVSNDVSLGDTGLDLPPGRWIHLWHIIDEDHYRHAGAAAQDGRDIGIGLYGRLSTHGFYRVHRLGLANKLRAAGLPIHVRDATQESLLSYDDYLALLARTRIRLSPSEAGLVGAFDRPLGTSPLVVRRHMNFTPWEAFMMGAMVLDSDDVTLPKFMRPGVEFVPYVGDADLIDKARYYLREETERRQIVANARAAMRERYSSTAYWTRIAERLQEAGNDRLAGAFSFDPPVGADA
jgi:hypothetical protein